MLIPYIDGLCVLDLHPGQDRLEPVAHVERLNIVKLYEIQLRCTSKYAKKEQEHPQKPKETPLTQSYPEGTRHAARSPPSRVPDKDHLQNLATDTFLGTTGEIGRTCAMEKPSLKSIIVP